MIITVIKRCQRDSFKLITIITTLLLIPSKFIDNTVKKGAIRTSYATWIYCCCCFSSSYCLLTRIVDIYTEQCCTTQWTNPILILNHIKMRLGTTTKYLMNQLVLTGILVDVPMNQLNLVKDLTLSRTCT